MQTDWTISLPLFIQITKNKRFYLNLNQYRNAHHHTLNKAKTLFTEDVLPLVQHLPYMEAIKLSYVLHVGSKSERDVANVCSVIDKFFSDTLVHAKKIPDDNWKVLPAVEYVFGSVDPKNPRVDVTIIYLP